MSVELEMPLSDYSYFWKSELYISQLLFAAFGTIYAGVFGWFVFLTLLDVRQFVREADRPHEKLSGRLMILASLLLLTFFLYNVAYKFVLGGFFGIYATWTSNEDWLVWVPSYHTR
eukprot:m.4563 g.4563  ORF g.4563 m.4563 type:complete len:116 (+) comp10950_c0_seq2:186-533(+)